LRRRNDEMDAEDERVMDEIDAERERLDATLE
jgi:hypothetical protein